MSVARRRKRPLRDQLTAEDRYVKIDPAPIDGRTPFEEGEFPITFLARSTDAEAAVLSVMLMHAGVPSMIIDFEALASSDFEWNIPGQDVRFKGGQLRPSVSWTRHFNMAALPISGNATLDIFRGESLAAFISQFHLACDSVVNRHYVGLLEQLSEAASLGIKIPATMVMSGSPPSSNRLQWDRVIVKALNHHFVEVAPGRLVGAFPEVMSRSEFLEADFDGSPPLVVQEFVEHDEEYRVYFVDGRVIAFKVDKPGPSALWLDESRVTVERRAPPDCISRAASSLASRLRLDYAAFDFLIAGNDAIFLEANLDGDWLWFENVAHDASVTKAVLDMLYTRRSRALQRVGRAAPA